MGRIIAVHLGINLLRYFVDVLVEDKDFEGSLVLFPNKRPILFAARYIHEKLNRACLLPKMQAFQDWSVEVYARSKEDPETLISDYDQAWIAYEAAREVLKDKKIVESWDSFMDWAFRLSDLFNRFDEELCDPKSVEYPYPDASKKARILLENLGDIYERYRQILESERLITTSGILRRLAEEGFPIPENRVYIVGFYALTKAESEIFKRMYDEGAVILWHTDPENLEPLYERWKKQWGISGIEAVKSEGEPEIKLYQCHGLHPELNKLNEVLGDPPDRFDRKAVVLLSQSALIPLLYSLPEWEVNITMGYPLKQTPIYALITSIEEVIRGKNRGNGKYSSKAVANLLMYPVLPEWLELSRRVLSKGAFVDPVEDGLESIFEALIFPFEKAKTPEEMADALLSVLSFIHKTAADESPIEKGFIAKTAEVAVDVLKKSLFAKESMSTRKLFVLLRKVLERVSVPFEGEPLRGLQVMGILETRLLSFDEVFVLDANEDVLPGIEEINPLVFWDPDIEGFPDRFREEAITRYHFRRLVASSKKVHIFWQQQSAPDKASLESKRERSRYVEQIIWEKEKKQRRRLENTLVEKTRLSISPEVLVVKDYLKKTKEQVEALKRLLKENKISASLLDLYITCPLRFYYEKLLELEPLDTPMEVVPKDVGEAMHKALEEYYKGFNLPAKVKRDDLDPEGLFNLFLKHFKPNSEISPEKEFLLHETVKYRLKTYVENQPEETEVLLAERFIEVPFFIDDEVGELVLCGRIDRVDRRNAEQLFNRKGGTFILVIDYKTGSKKTDASWNKDLFNLELPETFGKEESEEKLDFLRKKLISIQLPLYAFFSFKGDICPNEEKLTAAYVDLYREGKEKLYAKENNRLRKRDPLEPVYEFNQWIKEGGFEQLLIYMVKHMLKSPYWYPAPGEVCGYCPYRHFCKYS